jgi:hypothetical protein
MAQGVNAIVVVSPDSIIKVSDPEKHPGILNDSDDTKHTHAQKKNGIIIV